ncbi:hypothetical protein [Singulisphaera acidiphila]|uniref:Uncharacterized protein n=1 Tax=Singulisphaera acidiphila (strain ATCC BAA-1392 / DSM 18658 / VKM B-2454 / MOB10) TaxID=886293 RepID=L0DD30_SINAD|nr:hypothetical protein [Singulisphaera acidiphila]AGA27274.1 hypothetical protein Sinac_2991 [Singulisphaera acidiphila DSM 18658]
MPIPTIPLLADFAIRLACGLALLLLATPWRIVPPSFFRTHSQIILGLLVLAALDMSRAGVNVPAGVVIGAAVLAYLATVTWGLGLPRLALPTTSVIVLATAGILVAVSRDARAEAWALTASGRLASAFLMGSTFTAMLLGHHYLTAPAMSISPLRRFVKCMAGGLGIRAFVAGLSLWFWLNGPPGSNLSAGVSPLFLTIRWGMGFAGLALATVMTWKTVEIRSTQSATGILYIAVIFVLIGELTSLCSPAMG